MATSVGGSRYCFSVQWLDPHAKITRTFNLMLWEADLTVEIYDVANRRTFLKRTSPPEALRLEDFFIGGTVTVYSRRFAIKEYGDALTERRFQVARSTTLALVKPDGLPHLGKIISAVYNNGLDIGRVLMVRMSPRQATEFVASRPRAEQAALADHLSRDAVVALEVVGPDVVNTWHGVMGPADPDVAREAAPRSLRAQFGTDAIANAVYGSATPEDAKRELRMVFESEMPSPAVYTHCAMLIVKPHAWGAHVGGEIVDKVLEAGLEISAVKTLELTPQDAEDYLEVYKGVVPEYARWVAELSSGNALGLQVRGEDAVRRVRELAGPFDPEIGSHLYPESLRAVYGKSSVKNAVHVTDLERDGPLECKFLFQVV